MVRYDPQRGEHVAAYVSDRQWSSGIDAHYDFVRPMGAAIDTRVPEGVNILPNVATFDAVNGRIIIPLETYCGGCGPGYLEYWIVSIQGLAPLFDILQSYLPQPTALGFPVPAMPEGMAGADHFDTYWGPLTHPLDFTQAHPLQCGYPAAAPHVGDYLSVNDPLPDPEPGTGRYYVTSATYQGQTRYGRKTTAGHLTGRDPALLPACTP